jgi:hypothetical protein
VEINTPNRVSYSVDDSSMKEVVSGIELNIPPSAKRGAYRNADGDIITECEKGICKLGYNPVSTIPLETNYTFVSKSTDRVIRPRGSFRSYPSVKLAEIESNESAILDRISKETVSSRRDAVTRSKYELNEMMKELKNLVEVADKFVENHSDKQIEVRDKLSKATSSRKELADKLETTTKPADIRLEYNRSKRELDIASDISDSFQNMTKAIVDLRGSISKIKGAIEANNATLNGFSEMLKAPVDTIIY